MSTDDGAINIPKKGKEIVVDILHRAIGTFYAPEEILVFSFLAHQTMDSDGVSVKQIAEGLNCEPYSDSNVVITQALTNLRDIATRQVHTDNVTAALYEQTPENTHGSERWGINHKTAIELIFHRCMHIFQENTKKETRRDNHPVDDHGPEYWRCQECSIVVLPHEIASLEIDYETQQVVCPVCPETDTGEKVFLEHKCQEADGFEQNITVSADSTHPKDVLNMIKLSPNRDFPPALGAIIDILRLFIQHGPFFFPDRVSQQTDARMVLSSLDMEKKNAAEKQKQIDVAQKAADYKSLIYDGTNRQGAEDVPQNTKPPWFRRATVEEIRLPEVIFDFSRV